MSTDPSNLPYAEKFPNNDLFPQFAQYLNLQYGHNALLYVLRRPDNYINATWTEFYLRRYRSVKPEFMRQVYEHFSTLISQLQRVISLEESCTKSGAYRKDLELARERLYKIVQEIEIDEEKQRYLDGMLR